MGLIHDYMMGRLGAKLPDTRRKKLLTLWPKSASGSLAEFTARKALPLTSLTVDIDPVQAGSGDPSPDNVRPITGWTGANIYVSPTTEQTDATAYSVSFPDEAGTVYGGTLDVTKGVLTVDRIGMTFNGTEEWTTGGSGSAGFFRYIYSAVKSGGAARGCSHFENKTITTGTTTVGYYAYTSGTYNSVWLQFRPGLSGVSTAAQWKTWLADQATNGTPVTCWWKIQTPVTYQITPEEVTVLAGQNYVWADCGNVSLTYLK